MEDDARQETTNTAIVPSWDKTLVANVFDEFKQNVNKNFDELSENLEKAKKEIDEKFQIKDEEIKDRLNAIGIVIDENHYEFTNWTRAHIESHILFMRIFNKISKVIIGLAISSITELIIIIAILFKIL